MIKLPFVGRKAYNDIISFWRAASEEKEKQISITKYYQNLYAQAISSQDVLNSMLKDATSNEKFTYTKCSSCNNVVGVCTNDNGKN